MKGYVYQDSNNNWRARFTYTDQNKQRRYVKRREKINTEAGARAELLEIITEFDNSADPKITTLSHLCDYYEKEYCVPAEFMEGRKIVGLKDWKKVAYFLTLYRGVVA